MDVLLIGATGYIGSAVAGALQAVGHGIHGLARSDRAARTLQARGITPVPGDLQDPAGLEVAAHAADAVIYTGFIQHDSVAHVERAAIEAIIRGLQETGRPFIYTSAVWVLGHGDSSMASTRTPQDAPTSPIWRLLVENEVLDANARGLAGMVIRPAVVYGRGGGLVAALARSARDEGVARYPGSGDNRWPLVHIDDLAELYRVVLERAPSGELIFGGENYSALVRSMAEAAGRAAGTDGQTAPWSLTEARKILGPYADVLSLDQHISGACRCLGWRPTGPSVIEELEHGSYSRPMR